MRPLLVFLVWFRAIVFRLTNPGKPGIYKAHEGFGPLAQLVEQVTLNH